MVSECNLSQSDCTRRMSQSQLNLIRSKKNNSMCEALCDLLGAVPPEPPPVETAAVLPSGAGDGSCHLGGSFAARAADRVWQRGRMGLRRRQKKLLQLFITQLPDIRRFDVLLYLLLSWHPPFSCRNRRQDSPTWWISLVPTGGAEGCLLYKRHSSAPPRICTRCLYLLMATMDSDVYTVTGINTIYAHQTSVNMLDSGFTDWLNTVNTISRHSCSKYCVRHQIFKRRRLLVDALQHLCDQRKRQQRRPTGHGERLPSCRHAWMYGAYRTQRWDNFHLK